jgi:hypothetical protein
MTMGQAKVAVGCAGKRDDVMMTSAATRETFSWIVWEGGWPKTIVNP